MTSTLVAVSREDMAESQDRLLAWLTARVTETEAELREVEVQREEAQRRGWAKPPFEALLRRLRASVAWYGKLKAAVAAGYVMMPNMPMTLFAVRRRDGKRRPAKQPRGELAGANWISHPTLPGDALPIGEGAYVAPSAERDAVVEYEDKDHAGKPLAMVQWENVEHRAVALPVQLVKPALLEATNRALAEQVFDEIGLCEPWRGDTPGRSGDPLILGRIWRDSRRGRAVCFVIGWFVDLGDLR